MLSPPAGPPAKETAALAPDTHTPAPSAPHEPAGACGKGCLNGGTCDAPPACTCPDGFLGPRSKARAAPKAAAVQATTGQPEPHQPQPHPQPQPQPQPQRVPIVVQPAPPLTPQLATSAPKAAAAPALPPPADDTAKVLAALRAWRQRLQARQATWESHGSPAAAHLAAAGLAPLAAPAPHGVELTRAEKMWNKLSNLMCKACDDYYSFAIITSERLAQDLATSAARTRRSHARASAHVAADPRAAATHESRAGSLLSASLIRATPLPLPPNPGAAAGDSSGKEVMSSPVALTPPKIYARHYCEDGGEDTD